MIKSFRNLFKSSRRETEKEVEQFYNRHREKFISYFLKNDIEREEVEDIYHESFIELCDAIRENKVEERSTTSLKNYLFGIGRNKIMLYFREQKKMPQITMDVQPDIAESDDPEYFVKQEIVREVVGGMKDPCKKILRLCYWEQKSMLEIAGDMNYKDEDVAKTQKYKCMKKLKVLIKDIFRKEGFN